MKTWSVLPVFSVTKPNGEKYTFIFRWSKSEVYFRNKFRVTLSFKETSREWSGIYFSKVY